MATVKRRTTTTRQPDLFDAEIGPPEGFVYREEVISQRDEHALAEQFSLLPLAPFDFDGFVSRRRIVSFGWRYDYAGRRLRSSEDIPSFLMPLRERVAEIVAIAPQSLQQVLVTEYRPGAAIGWHLDKPMFDDVIALSFLSTCTLRFRRKQEESWERWSTQVMPRSAYVLRGPSRGRWQHSVPPVSELRYSVTFRNLVPSRSP
jgi:alkylated DNA repair dioxygenase AlkB